MNALSLHFGTQITPSNIDSVFSPNKKPQVAWYSYLSEETKAKFAELQNRQANFWESYFTTMGPASKVSTFHASTLPLQLKTLFDQIKAKVYEILPATWEAMQRHATDMNAQNVSEKSNGS
jgi:hypothetical protein